jgi:type I restriction enzyme M protein
VAGFCKVATLDEVKEHRYALTPGRYVGAAEGDDEDEAFEERWPRLLAALESQLASARDLDVKLSIELEKVRP